MKNFFCFALLVFSIQVFPNGVGVINAETGQYLRLLSSTVDVKVESQIARIITTQSFKNIYTSNKVVKYVFPMPEGGSATGLKWKINGIWKTAIFSPVPQDTSLGGGSVYPNLKTYMGKTPLFFGIPDTIRTDSILTVEMTYVQLLKYSFGNVYFNYPNDYRLIQSLPLSLQELKFTLVSPRTIDSLICISHSPQILTNNGNTAYLQFSSSETIADRNYDLKYSLNLNQLGLFSYSTSISDSTLPDSLGKGLFLFIAEPNPSPAIGALPKVFTLIIDRSGSMSGTKIEQAKNAASFIVQNLNDGDKFNLIDFDDVITSFRPNHVVFNQDNKQAALNYIATLSARGLTNISGAFSTAIPQFVGNSDSSAKIIIFLTDGQPTAGITSTSGILSHINTLTQQIDTSINIFCFGIGSDVNKQLLTLISAQHHGLAEFLGNDELYSRITLFYNQIRNPVLLNTKLSFVPNIITEVFPNPLQNLYKGQQLLVAGRYQTANTLSVNLTGNAFNQPVLYSYQVSLSDTNNINNQFLTKIWAKLKIENLLVWYYSLDPNSPTALEIKQMIIRVSTSYGVLSPFTSFSGGPTGIEENSSNEIINPTDEEFILLGNYPNPFNPETKITFIVNNLGSEFAIIKIFNLLGELIRSYIIVIHGEGKYEVIWDGKTEEGKPVTSGNYVYIISHGNKVLSGKMTLIR